MGKRQNFEWHSSFEKQMHSVEKRLTQGTRFKISLHLQILMPYLTAFVHETILITKERNSINKAIMAITMSF